MSDEFTPGRQPLTIVEIEQDFCEQTYGEFSEVLLSAANTTPSVVPDLVGGANGQPMASSGTGPKSGSFLGTHGLSFFPGNGEWLMCGDPGPSDMRRSYTMECEFITGSSDLMVILARDTLTSPARCAHIRLQDGAQFYFVRHDVSGNIIETVIGTHTPANDGQLHMASAVFDIDAGGSRIYLDGVLVGSSSNVTENNDGDGIPITIGTIRHADPIFFWDGGLRQARIWSYGRSQAEIVDTMFQPLTGKEPGLIHYWPMTQLDGCLASINVTGSQECFNTHRTCQDPDNYIRGERTLRFVKPNIQIPKDHPAYFPFLDSVATIPTRINVAGGGRNTQPLGTRGVVDARFRDAPHSDFWVDPYRENRLYVPLERGTFWGKWKARNPYYQNRLMRVREGYVGQAPASMETRHYFIEQVIGPDAGGNVTVRAKDVLKLADDDRAQFPPLSLGSLRDPITDTATSFIVVGDVVATYNPPIGTVNTAVRIGDEVLVWGTISQVGDEVHFGSVTRGQFHTAASSHAAGDLVQHAPQFTNLPIIVVLQYLLENVAEVPSAFIPIADWNDEASVWLQGANITGILVEPTGVRQLIAELTEQFMFYIWWDERQQEVRLKAVRPHDASLDGPIFTGDDFLNVIEGSARITEEPSERVSQIWTFWGQLNPTRPLDDMSNFRRVRILGDANAESAEQYGERRVRRVFARWLTTDAQVITLNSRLLARYRDNSRYVTIQMDAKDRQLSVGDVSDLEIRQCQDFTGAPCLERYQIISRKAVEAGHRYEYIAQRFFFQISLRYARFMLNGSPVYGSASEAQKDNGAFFSDGSSDFPDGGEPYRFI